MSPISRNNMNKLERLSMSITDNMGSPTSILIHTIGFVVIFVLYFFGVSFNDILLILTTIVSLEAIYLSLFIQMTVNRNTESLEEVEEDLENLESEVKEIGQDIEEIHEDDKKDDAIEAHQSKTLESIALELQKLLTDIEALKKTK